MLRSKITVDGDEAIDSMDFPSVCQNN